MWVLIYIEGMLIDDQTVMNMLCLKIESLAGQSCHFCMFVKKKGSYFFKLRLYQFIYYVVVTFFM